MALQSRMMEGYQSASSLWIVEFGVGAVVKWSCGVIERCVNMSVSQHPSHWLPTIAQSSCQSEIRSASEPLGTPTQPLHPPRAWHPIVRSFVSSTVHRLRFGKFVSMISLRFVVLFATVHVL